MNQKGLEPMTQVNVRMDREDKEKLAMLADMDRRTLSDSIRIVLQNHIKEKGM